MVKSDVSPKNAQSLARYSTIDLTMNVYTSLTVHDQAAALSSLPVTPVSGQPVSDAGALRATGTDGPKKVPTMVPRGAEYGAIHLASYPCEDAPDCTEKEDNDTSTARMENARSPGKSRASCTSSHQIASDCQGGEGGIRTPGTREGTPVFKTGAFGHSATSP